MERLIASIEKNSRETIQVSLTQYQGHDLADVRVHYDSDGEWKPTKKGIALKIGLLPDLIGALQTAEAEARAAGLLNVEVAE